MAGHLYIVAYDISSRRERQRTSKILEGFGVRFQESVFLCRLDSTQLLELERTLEKKPITTGCVMIHRSAESFHPLTLGHSNDCLTVQSEGHAWII